MVRSLVTGSQKSPSAREPIVRFTHTRDVCVKRTGGARSAAAVHSTTLSKKEGETDLGRVSPCKLRTVTSSPE